jgi:hypothetical protein
MDDILPPGPILPDLFTKALTDEDDVQGQTFCVRLNDGTEQIARLLSIHDGEMRLAYPDEDGDVVHLSSSDVRHIYWPPYPTSFSQVH